MRLPFVARSTYDAERQRTTLAVSAMVDAQHQRDNAMTLMKDVLEKYHGLKLQGAVYEAPKPTALPRASRNVVAEAIAFAGGSDATLRKRLGQFALDSRLKQMSEEEIADRILHWTDESDDALEPSFAGLAD
jgi:hypothetical protein